MHVPDVFNANVVADSAFLGDTPLCDCIKCSKMCLMGAEELLVNIDATSRRQTSEWGMRQLRGRFPCTKKDALLYKEKGDSG